MSSTRIPGSSPQTEPTDVVPAAAACCAPGNPEPLEEAVAQDLARVFKALGDPTRVRLLSMITASADGEMCLCDLTEPVGLSQPTVSHHMKVLADAGLVQREQRGRWAYYSPSTQALADAARLVAG